MIFRIVVWIIMIFGGTILGIILDLKMFPEIFKSVVFHILSAIAGFFVLRLMIIISRNTGRTLAKYGRQGNLPRMQTNVLVKQGVYAKMRHPMHLGLFLFPVGTALLVGSVSFLLFIAPAEILFMLIMIKIMEEPEAIKKFGNEYLEYKNQTPAFCLKKDCIKELLKKIEKQY